MTVTALLAALSFLPYFEARNQVANFVLAPPAEGAEEVRPLKPDLEVRSVCPACEGKGKLLLVEPDFGQQTGRLGGPKKTTVKCTLCKGRGRIESFADPAELTVQVAKDREAFAANHQGKGEIAAGHAFVPNAAFNDEANKKKLKLVEEAFGKPCSKCEWTGIEACRKCHGHGFLDCPEDDCKGGFLVSKVTTEKSYSRSGGSGGYNRGSLGGGSRRTTKKETKVTVQVCPTCGGAKKIACPACGGRKATPCKACSGLGFKQKARSL